MGRILQGIRKERAEQSNGNLRPVGPWLMKTARVIQVLDPHVCASNLPTCLSVRASSQKNTQTHICVYVYLCTYVSMSRWIYGSVNVCMHVCTYVCIYVCVYIYASMYLCMHACMCADMHICMCIHIHVHVYMYINDIYIYICLFILCIFPCVNVCM